MKKSISVLMSFVLFFSAFVFVNEAEAGGRFSDTRNHWAEKEINYLSSLGIISGYTNGSFKPDISVTRGQTAIMLARALNLDLANRPNPGFKDVSTKHSAYKHIAAIIDEGIYPKGVNYSPDKALTREEMARMIVNAYSLTGQKNIIFKDVSKSYWAQPYISVLAENGITAGYSNGTFKPKDVVTRGQFSVFLSRVLNDNYRVEPPAPSKTTPVLMKDITFGMTYQQVKNRETRTLVEDLGDSSVALLAYITSKYGYNAYLEYYFENNRLEYIAYNFLEDDNSYHTRSELASMHNTLHKEGIKEFGNDYFYYDEDYPSNRFVTSWKKSNFDVILSVNDDNLYSRVNLIYFKPFARSAANDKSNNLHQVQDELEKINVELRK